jgi:undecaprenyl-diphosphatase
MLGRLDVRILYFFNNLAGKSRPFDALAVFLAAHLQYFLAALFPLFLYLSAYSNQEKLAIGWITATSILVARFGVIEAIRLWYRRPRPFFALPVHKLLSNDWFYSDMEPSFPSGHAAFFFAMAGAVYFYNGTWGTGFFISAVLMNISRIIAGVHYPSDTLAGAVVGIGTAYFIHYAV